MELLQLLGSLIAIFLLALLAKSLFSDTQPLSQERIVQNITRYCPAIPPDVVNSANIIIGDNMQSAIVIFPETTHGIATLIQLGDRVVVRHHENNEACTIKGTDTGILVDPKDFTMPPVKISLKNEVKANVLEALHNHNFIKNISAEGPAHA